MGASGQIEGRIRSILHAATKRDLPKVDERTCSTRPLPVYVWDSILIDAIRVAAWCGIGIMNKRHIKYPYAMTGKICGVIVPPWDHFYSSFDAAHTVYHELTHVARYKLGHPIDKLDLTSAEFAKEEVIAETTACLLCWERYGGVLPAGMQYLANSVLSVCVRAPDVDAIEFIGSVAQGVSKVYEWIDSKQHGRGRAGVSFDNSNINGAVP